MSVIKSFEFGGMAIAESDRSAGNMDPRFGRYREVFENRDRIIGKIGLPIENVAVISPQSSNEFIDLGSKRKFNIFEPLPVDGLITRDVRVGLMLNSADCIPMAFSDMDAEITGLAHLGWRGIVGDLHKKMIDHATKSGLNTSTSYAYLGPSIQAKSYVGEARSESQKTDLWDECITEDPETGLLHFDFPKYVVGQLVELGFSMSNVRVSATDTGSDNQYFSFTRHKFDPKNIPDGRNGFVVRQRS